MEIVHNVNEFRYHAPLQECYTLNHSHCSDYGNDINQINDRN